MRWFYKGKYMSWKKTTLIAVPLLALSACSLGVREDYDTIGSIRKSYTLGWKEGPREEPYRPYRNQTNYYQQQPQQQQQDCEPTAPAAPGNGWAPAWEKGS